MGGEPPAQTRIVAEVTQHEICGPAYLSPEMSVIVEIPKWASSSSGNQRFFGGTIH